MGRLIPILALLATFTASAAAQTSTPSDKAQAVIAKAVAAMGGEGYLNVKTLVAKGRYSQIREGANSGTQTFIDIVVFPDSERTEFKNGKVKTVQVNVGSTGWFYQGETEVIGDQSEKQTADFRRGMALSLDNLLRGSWKGKADLSYVGTRDAGIGKRSDVVRLTYKTGEWVEFEFGNDGFPIRNLYKRADADGGESRDEDRFGQFLDIGGVKFPFVVDHYVEGAQTSRINYESVEFNRTIPASVFAKPADVKEFKKDLKF